jgi:hypothetical protein
VTDTKHTFWANVWWMVKFWALFFLVFAAFMALIWVVTL